MNKVTVISLKLHPKWHKLIADHAENLKLPTKPIITKARFLHRMLEQGIMINTLAKNPNAEYNTPAIHEAAKYLLNMKIDAQTGGKLLRMSTLDERVGSWVLATTDGVTATHRIKQHIARLTLKFANTMNVSHSRAVFGLFQTGLSLYLDDNKQHKSAYKIMQNMRLVELDPDSGSTQVTIFNPSEHIPITGEIT